MASPAKRILTVNSGSSSLKLSVFDVDDHHGARPTARAEVDGIGVPERGCATHVDALGIALDALGDRALHALDAIGHRVAHGGERFTSHVGVDAEVRAALSELLPLAPLHMPPALAMIDALATRGVPQVACFDTVFHASMPEVARRLPIPERFASLGMRRFGFHGLSFEHVMSKLGQPPPSRVVIAHLGSGASLVAVANGRAIDTTMGFTPAGGVLMGTRSGDIDPGVVLHMARIGGLGVDALESVLTRESGLLGVGGASDMRVLLSRAKTDARAGLAVEMFGYAVRKAIGALAVALGGIDALVFTGGIGERSPVVRAEACRGLEALGVTLDADANERGDARVDAPTSRSGIWVVTADEASVVARHTARHVAR